MKELAYAKINLILEIKGKRTDGYHELRSLMIPIEFYDTLEFFISEEDQVISNVEIENNAILKTISYMRSQIGFKENVLVKLNKVIPIGSGLGGGSADISATIRGVNRLLNLDLTDEVMGDIANQLGSDTLFTLNNRPAIVEGRGDKIKFIDMTHKLESILLILPNISLLTKDIFKAFKSSNKNDFDRSVTDVLSGKLNLYNDLLEPALEVSKSLSDLYHSLKSDGFDVYMSGSGSTLFVVNPDEVLLNRIKMYQNVTLIHTKQH